MIRIIEKKINGRSSREEVLKAVKQDGIQLQFANKRFLKDKEVVLEAVREDIEAINFADEKFLDDQEIMFTVVKESPRALKNASKRLLADKTVVAEALKKNGDVLKYADKELCKDKELVSIAIKNNGDALKYADKELCKDKELVFNAIKTFVSNKHNAGLVPFTFFEKCPLEYADEELRKDKKIVLEAVKIDYNALKYADEELRKEKKFVLEATEINASALGYADEELLKDKEFLLEAAKYNDRVVKYADKELWKDRNFSLEALKRNFYMDMDVGRMVAGVKEIEIKEIEDNWRLGIVDDKLRSDKKVMLEALKLNSNALNNIDEELLKDKEFLLEAVKINVDVLKHVDKNFTNDKEIMLEAFKFNNDALKKYAYPSLLGNEDFILEATKINPKALNYADRILKTKRFMLEAIKSHPGAITHCDSKLFIDDKEFRLEAIKIDTRISGYIRFDAKESEEALKARRLEYQNNPYRKVAKQALINWNGMSEEEANEIVIKSTFENIEKKVGAETSINYAIDEIAKKLGLDESNKIKNEAYSSYDHDILSKNSEFLNDPDNVIDILSAVHDGWVKDNQNKFMQESRNKQYQHMPIELIGWEEAKADLLFFKPLLEVNGNEIDENKLKEKYNERVKQFLDSRNITNRQQLKENILEISVLYHALDGQYEILDKLFDEELVEKITGQLEEKNNELYKLIHSKDEISMLKEQLAKKDKELQEKQAKIKELEEKQNIKE